jgi:hypothetical protein
MALNSYGSSKSFSSGSSSFMSSGSESSKGMGGGSMSSTSSSESSSGSSCICEFLIEVELINNDEAVVSITNIGTCDLSIMGIYWDFNGTSAGSTGLLMPVLLTAGTFQDFTIIESYDIRGLSATVSTTCYEAVFTIPVS